ncbi:Fic family protein [Brachybacterium sp. AOP35-5H-19]|uniref:Fic family protein n=2 Tax=Brachybacterium TaxID=43668 RepID=UPI004033FBEC
MSNDDQTWPALATEVQSWTPTAGFGIRADRYPGEQRYESAIVPEIAGVTPRVSSEVMTAAEDAALSLSRLDAELGERVASFAPVLLRSEAASSSQIENLTASARSIMSAELGARTGQNAVQIAANTRAMTAAIELADELSESSILRMHEVLLSSQPRHTPGRWRDEAVWIGTRSDTPVGAEFVAPHHSRIPHLIDDLVSFLHRSDMPSLIAVAVSHAQFETIHPFSDGNGRTGRALAQSQLRRLGVTRNVAIPVSAGLLADVPGYHSALGAYRNGDITPIIAAFSDASLRAVRNTRELVDEIEEIRAGWTERLTARRSSNAWRLLDVLMRRPVLTSAAAAAELGVKQPNVYPPLKALEDAGILASKNEYQLGPFWRSDEILAAIDRFAERAGRRSLT